MIKKLESALNTARLILTGAAAWLICLGIVCAPFYLGSYLLGNKPAGASPVPDMDDPGKQRCQDWVVNGSPDNPEDGGDVAQEKYREYSEEKTWVQGFIAGASKQGGLEIPAALSTKAGQLERSLDSYCQSHRQDTLDAAASALSSELVAPIPEAVAT